jgi:hypothetical protein
MPNSFEGSGLEIDGTSSGQEPDMIEDDAALHRCVNAFVEHAENLRAAGHSLNFIVQALQGAIARLSAPDEGATVVTLPHSE